MGAALRTGTPGVAAAGTGVPSVAAVGDSTHGRGACIGATSKRGGAGASKPAIGVWAGAANEGGCPRGVRRTRPAFPAVPRSVGRAGPGAPAGETATGRAITVVAAVSVALLSPSGLLTSDTNVHPMRATDPRASNATAVICARLRGTREAVTVSLSSSSSGSAPDADAASFVWPVRCAISSCSPSAKNSCVSEDGAFAGTGVGAPGGRRCCSRNARRSDDNRARGAARRDR